MNVAPNGKIAMEYVKSNVLNKDIRQRMQGTSSHSKVFIIEYRGMNRNRGQDNNRG